ncbi:hypothetical protein Bca52824_086975 [Brassica carinata]|uniref:Uncharacterized protein n=1 Tax=Brassica carinata TaxID=52824 RepID=A0A8X7PB27_BRACI|nr:hypothetical protein Bca52824_086975 [Brassica carinata]
MKEPLLRRLRASARPIIPTELFRFMTYGRILELANTGKQLPGIGENVCVSMFDSLALVFHTKFDSYGREPKVIVATGLNPKIVGGLLFLNATSATHLYFDSETAARKKLFGTLPGHGAVPGGSTSKVVHAQKIEPMTISELNQFIITADSQMAKLTNIQASEAAQIVGIGVDAQVDTELPQSLADIVGKTYTFQLKLNDFNFSSKHQTFTISRIFPQRVLAPMPAFVEGATVPADAQAGDLPQGTISNIGITSTGADKPTTSDASTVKRPPPAKDQDDVDKTAPKKAHVE